MSPKVPNRLPAESLVFCVEEACILEARKASLVVSMHLYAKEAAGDIKLMVS